PLAAQIHDLISPPVGRDHVAGFRLDARQRVGQDQEVPDLGLDRQARFIGDLKAGLPEGRLDGPELRRPAVLDRAGAVRRAHLLQPLGALAKQVSHDHCSSRTRTVASASAAARTALPRYLLPVSNSVVCLAVASQYTFLPTAMAVSLATFFGKSKTPATASAPSVPAGMSRLATPIRSPCTTTSPAATSLLGV